MQTCRQKEDSKFCEGQSGSLCQITKRNARYAIDCSIIHHAFCLAEPDQPVVASHTFTKKPSSIYLSTTTCPRPTDMSDTRIYKRIVSSYDTLQEHFPGVFDILLDLDQESHSLPTVE
jgi:hypothetical protein